MMLRCCRPRRLLLICSAASALTLPLLVLRRGPSFRYVASRLRPMNLSAYEAGVQQMHMPEETNQLSIMDATRTAQRKWATAHYVWCGDRVFRFENFLSLMSLVTTFNPIKVVFHYERLPQQTEYNSWFNISRDRIAILELLALPKGVCEGKLAAGPLIVARILARAGGVWAGDATLVTPVLLELEKALVSHSDPWGMINGKVKDGQGVVMVTPYTPLSESKEEAKTQQLRTVLLSPPEFSCLQASKPTDFWDRINDTRGGKVDQSPLPPCLSFDGANVSSADPDHVLHPRDIWTLDSALGRAARLAFYGTQKAQWPVQDSQQLAPLISHQIWFHDPNFRFDHFLAVQSALHVAKFPRVFFHTNIIPSGKYWDAMMKRDGHRIIVIPLMPSSQIFGNPVSEVRHLSDVLRPVVLSKYGGVYQDRDVVYTSPIPQALLAYECVKSFDWPRYGEYPEAISPGFIIAKPGARWLKIWTDSMKDYREHDVLYNSIRLPYRHLELNPTLLHTDRHVQVVCYFGVCHPPWKKSYQQGYLTPEDNDWSWERDTSALHVTFPKPPKEWESPNSLLAARLHLNDSIFAAVGWNVVEKAGLEDLLYKLA